MQHAPAWTLAHTVAVSVCRASTSRTCAACARAAVTALELVEAVAAALTFPDGRAATLVRADVALVRLRACLRVAADVGSIQPEAARPDLERWVELGRMIGGWRREVRRRAREGDTQTASSEAGRSTTPPTGVALRTATGTGRGTPGTTRGSASSFLPPPAVEP